MTTLRWQKPDWLQAAHRWIRDELDHQGLTLLGEVEQPHIRPWATVLRIASEHGWLYFKATAPVFAYEASLTQALARWCPDCLPRILAIEPTKGWLLMMDAGQPLRSRIQSVADFHLIEQALAIYAEFQIQMIDRTTELLALGLPDRRLNILPSLFEGLLRDESAMRIDQADGLSSREFQQLQERLPIFSDECCQLAQLPIPACLHHDDFHDANIFIDGVHTRFTDWGESQLAPALFSMLILPRSLAYRLKLPDSAPELKRLQEVYLEPWQSFASRQELEQAFALARRLAMVNRAITWYQVIYSLEPEFREPYLDAVPGWLQEYLMAEITG